jgi:hypothetical protein
MARGCKVQVSIGFLNTGCCLHKCVHLPVYILTMNTLFNKVYHFNKGLVFFLRYWEVELRALCLLGKPSATLPALFVLTSLR